MRQREARLDQGSQPAGASPLPRISLIWFAAGAIGIALLLFAYYACTWHSLSNFRAAIDTCAQSFCDFSTFYYPMGEAIFRTGLPVTGFVYSPFTAILLAGFPPLGFNVSLVLWGLLQAIFIIMYLLLFRRLVPAGLPIQLLFVALALSSFPLLHNLTWGQVGILTTVIILGMLVFLEHDQRILAAALFALAVSFKFYPLIFLAPFAARRDIRVLIPATVACVAFLFVIPGLLLGAGDTLRFYSALLEEYREFDWVVSNYNSQHFPHVILRLAEAMGQNAHAALPFLYWISYSIAAANLGLLFLVQRARLPQADLWSFHLLFLSIPFVLYTSWPVDLVFISFTQALLGWRLLEVEGADPQGEAMVKSPDEAAWRKWPSLARATGILFLLISIVISNIGFFNLLGDRGLYGFFGFIFWSDTLLLITSYIELLPPALRVILARSAVNLPFISRGKKTRLA